MVDHPIEMESISKCKCRNISTKRAKNREHCRVLASTTLNYNNSSKNVLSWCHFWPLRTFGARTMSPLKASIWDFFCYSANVYVYPLCFIFKTPNHAWNLELESCFPTNTTLHRSFISKLWSVCAMGSRVTNRLQCCGQYVRCLHFMG